MFPYTVLFSNEGGDICCEFVMADGSKEAYQEAKRQYSLGIEGNYEVDSVFIATFHGHIQPANIAE